MADFVTQKYPHGVGVAEMFTLLMELTQFSQSDVESMLFEIGHTHNTNNIELVTESFMQMHVPSIPMDTEQGALLCKEVEIFLQGCDDIDTQRSVRRRRGGDGTDGGTGIGGGGIGGTGSGGGGGIGGTGSGGGIGGIGGTGSGGDSDSVLGEMSLQDENSGVEHMGMSLSDRDDAMQSVEGVVVDGEGGVFGRVPLRMRNTNTEGSPPVRKRRKGKGAKEKRSSAVNAEARLCDAEMSDAVVVGVEGGDVEDVAEGCDAWESGGILEETEDVADVDDFVMVDVGGGDDGLVDISTKEEAYEKLKTMRVTLEIEAGSEPSKAVPISAAQVLTSLKMSRGLMTHCVIGETDVRNVRQHDALDQQCNTFCFVSKMDPKGSTPEEIQQIIYLLDQMNRFYTTQRPPASSRVADEIFDVPMASVNGARTMHSNGVVFHKMIVNDENVTVPLPSLALQTDLQLLG